MKKYSAELISFGLLVCGIGLSWGNVAWFQTEIVRFVWYLVAFIPVGFPVLKEAVECLREKEYFNEFMLMSLAAIGAFYIGEYPEGVAVMLFYSIGEKFQDSAVSRARSNIRALLDVRPEQATVIRDGQEKIEKPESIFRRLEVTGYNYVALHVYSIIPIMSLSFSMPSFRISPGRASTISFEA